VTDRLAELERENAKLRKINRVLMDRVERSMDYQGNAFSLFQTAIALDGKVQERTQALESAMHDLEAANRAVSAAKAEAERANLSKTRFLAAASHDLLQPLNAARIFASALAERRMAPNNRTLVDSTLTALDSVEDILTALLDISKLDAGVLPSVVADFGVGEMFATLAREYRMVAARRNRSLRFLPCSLAVRSDPRLLARIIRNYISNALRYTEAGGRIVVGCRRRGAAVLIGVWDDGPGIPADKQDAIFEEFRRLDDCGRREQGMGLGLAIVKRMAKVLDHPVVVRSTVGCGSLFGIEVPTTGPVAVAIRPRGAPLVPGSVLSGALVAVVDDDAEIVAGMRSLLGHWGCEVVAALSGPDALAALAERGRAPDVVLADYTLDHGEIGVDAVAAIRDRFGTAIPAAIITADHSAALLERVQAAGCHLMNKPLHRAKLRSLLAHLLRNRAGG
jgi:signal transduction histidine kinase